MTDDWSGEVIDASKSVTEPTQDALHAETLAELATEEANARRLAAAPVYDDEDWARIAERYAHAAACVRRVSELEALAEFRRCELEAVRIENLGVRAENRRLEAEVERLRAECAAKVRAELGPTTRPSAKRLNFLANLAFEHPHVRLRLNAGEWTLDTGNATIGRGRTCNDAIDSAMEAQP